MTPSTIIEALIFVSENPLKPAQIAELFKSQEFVDADGLHMEMTEESAKEILDELVTKYETSETPWSLRRIGGGYQFLSRKEYFPFLRSAVLQKNQRKLSRAALETLSIIAYRQPVTRPEIEFIRGVNCDYAIQKLLEKNLILMAGRSDSAGKPLLYKTSPYFFEYFAINDISDLPKLQEIAIDEDEFQRQFQTFSEEHDEMKKVVDEIEGEGKTKRKKESGSESESAEIVKSESESESGEIVRSESEGESAEATTEEISGESETAVENEVIEEGIAPGEIDFTEEENTEDEPGFFEEESAEEGPITPE